MLQHPFQKCVYCGLQAIPYCWTHAPPIGLLGAFAQPNMVKSSQKDFSSQQATFINLADAHLCSDCEAVGDSAIRCPRCQSEALIAVTRAIRRHRDSIRLVCVPLDEQAEQAA